MNDNPNSNGLNTLNFYGMIVTDVFN